MESTKTVEDKVESTPAPYDVQVTIASMRGRCSRGHKVGQTGLLNGYTPAGMCEQAYLSIAPVARIYRYGGCPPADRGGHKYMGCVDPKGPIFELKRIPVEEPCHVDVEEKDKC